MSNRPKNAPSQSRRKLLAGAAIIALAALLAYLPSLSGGFILDDDALVTDSPLIQDSSGLQRIWFTTEPVDYWPLTNTSFWIEWRLWRMNPTGYHVTNLVLHIAAALLIWLILKKLSIPGAWLAALLFAVHPVNVESVAWISQRKNTLSMLFFLLSILWYLKANLGCGRWYWLSFLAFALAMLSKGSVAILPLVLLLLTWWQRAELSSWDLLRTAPFFVVAVVLAAMNVWFQTHGSGEMIRSATFLQRSLGAGAVVWFYLYKALVPLNLAFIYPQWSIDSNDWRWWAPLAATVIVTTALIWRRRTRLGRPLLFAWLFYCIALVPVMGFTDVGFMKYSLVADRYLHIAIIGVVALLAAGACLLYQRRPGPARSAAGVAAALVTVLLALLSWRQSSLYAGAITLYQDALLKNPDSWLLHNNLGTALKINGRPEEAIEHYQATLRLNPDFPEGYYNLGKSLIDSGRFQDGVQQLHQALQLKPDYPEAHDRLGLAYSNAGQSQPAIEHFQQALQLKPDYPGVHNNLGIELARLGRLQEAIDHYGQALRLKPDYPAAQNNLGSALKQLGRYQEAIEHCQQALRLQPDYPEAYANLATIYAKMNRSEEALASAQKALDLARSSDQSDLAQRIEAWLAAYRARLSSRDDTLPRANPDAPP